MKVMLQLFTRFNCDADSIGKGKSVQVKTHIDFLGEIANISTLVTLKNQSKNNLISSKRDQKYSICICLRYNDPQLKFFTKRIKIYFLSFSSSAIVNDSNRK